MPLRSKYLLAGLLLTGCASAGSAPPKAAAAALPGFSPVSGPVVRDGRYTQAPASVVAFVAALPTQSVLLPVSLRQKLLSGQVYLRTLPGTGGRSDYLLADQNGARYSLWLRSFQGREPGTTGYLLQMRMACSAIDAAQAQAEEEDLSAARRACAQAHAEYADTGLRAYRIADGQAPEDVSASLKAPERALGRARLDRYDAQGADPIAVDDSRIDAAPTLRWVVNADPEQPLPAKDERVFQGGYKSHAGFVIWNGDGFEVRDSVPRALWPCPASADAPCPDPQDRYVSGAK
ncbi:hypothetical protein [Lysobacter silvisoli]|uniref:Uncharacterized protein n=1 Tax=Lysobacter silvisoli TaxID=2293254 RepID=A0A371K1J6_9GAMM|nr:hypothetical protein [Lysobacter silvisoli]RDZ27801.1 hypothetical protein DX914_01105 [Lysobacter silvisoli]